MNNKDILINQWGGIAVPFRTLNSEQKYNLLLYSKHLIEDIKKQLNIDCFLSYGGLLGAVRTGSLIEYDFDLDFIFLAQDDQLHIHNTAENLINYFIEKNFYVDAESNGQFRIKDKSNIFSLEFFAGWFHEKKFYQYFTIQGSCNVDDVLPLQKIKLDGVDIPIPNNPSKILEHIYGKNWKIPDPGFKYHLTEKDWEPFKFLFYKVNNNFWENYYKNENKNLVWIEEPTDFALFIFNNYNFNKIIEFGCGNGRDGLFFAKKDINSTLIDYSNHALNFCRKRIEQTGVNINIEPLNVNNIAECRRFSKKNYQKFDIVYSRFFLHSINELAQQNFINLAKDILKTNGYFALEFRSDPGGSYNPVYANGEHYRRLVKHQEFEAVVQKTGFITDYHLSSYGLAKYKDEDPFITRFVLKKK